MDRKDSKVNASRLAGAMHKREERMPDGRLIVYYSFSSEASHVHSEASQVHSESSQTHSENSQQHSEAAGAAGTSKDKRGQPGKNDG